MLNYERCLSDLDTVSSVDACSYLDVPENAASPTSVLVSSIRTTDEASPLPDGGSSESDDPLSSPGESSSHFVGCSQQPSAVALSKRSISVTSEMSIKSQNHTISAPPFPDIVTAGSTCGTVSCERSPSEAVDVCDVAIEARFGSPPRIASAMMR